MWGPPLVLPPLATDPFTTLTPCLTPTNIIVGRDLIIIGSEFVRNTSSAQLRARTIEAGRAVLMMVARLLIIADTIDLQLILRQADKVSLTFEISVEKNF
jgi:hypothetical protein